MLPLILPVETLTQIVRNLRVNEELIPRMSRDSACDLASIARVSHLFYELAMPLLWEEVELWSSHEWPWFLSSYPATASKRALSYIRTMRLSVHEQRDEWTMAKFNELYTYMCGCFRVLGHAGSVSVYESVCGLIRS